MHTFKHLNVLFQVCKVSANLKNLFGFIIIIIHSFVTILFLSLFSSQFYFFLFSSFLSFIFFFLTFRTFFPFWFFGFILYRISKEFFGLKEPFVRFSKIAHIFFNDILEQNTRESSWNLICVHFIKNSHIFFVVDLLLGSSGWISLNPLHPPVILHKNSL